MAKMHRPHTLLIEIARDGAVEIVVKEPAGKGCQGLADDLALALGQIEEKGRTADYFKPAIQRRTHLERK